MRTPETASVITPGSIVVHPPGEVHEFSNGSERPLLFDVRYGSDMRVHYLEWRGRSASCTFGRAITRALYAARSFIRGRSSLVASAHRSMM